MTLMIMRNLAGIRLLRAAACVASAALALACGKENIKPDVDEDTDIKEGKVVTFTGRFAEDPDDDENPSTKIALDYDTENSKVKVKFSGGEYIKTIVGGGGAENVIKASDINADGSVTFSIGFESTSDPYCFFVADQINTFGSLWKVSPGPVMYTRSNAYNTIAAGRIPHFAWGTCNHDEKNVTFHNILCLLRYTTTTEEASYVDFVGNDGETLIGSMGINYSTGKVTLNTQGVDAYTSVRSNIAGPGKDNYIALMPNVTLSKGFLIKVYDKSGNELYICRVNSEFTTTAGKLIDLGTLEDHKASQYNRWLSGYDIEINGVKYNNTNSTATLVKNSAFAGEDVETGKASLYFIDGEATMGTSTGSNVIVCSNSATSRAKLTFKGKTGIIACNPLVFKDLNIESLTSGYTLAASGSVSQLTFDNCTLTLHSDFADLSSVTSVGKIEMVDCDVIADFSSGSSCRLFYTGDKEDKFTIASLLFKNNIFWSGNPSVEFSIFAADNTDATVSTDNLYLENNTFYNVDCGSYSAGFKPFIMLGTVKKTCSLKANLAYSPNGLDTTPLNTSRTAYLLGCYSEDYAAQVDIAAKLANTSAWYGYSSALGGLCIYTDANGTLNYLQTGMKTVENDPYEGLDPTAGTYPKKATYAGYGATR